MPVNFQISEGYREEDASSSTSGRSQVLATVTSARSVTRFDLWGDRGVQSRGRELTRPLDELLQTDNTCEPALPFTIKEITHKINEVSDETVEPSDYENMPDMVNKAGAS